MTGREGALGLAPTLLWLCFILFGAGLGGAGGEVEIGEAGNWLGRQRHVLDKDDF